MLAAMRRRPVKPNTSHLDDIRRAAGNEQLLAIYNLRDELKQQIEAWQALVTVFRSVYRPGKTYKPLPAMPSRSMVPRCCKPRSIKLKSSAYCWPSRTLWHR